MGKRRRNKRKGGGTASPKVPTVLTPTASGGRFIRRHSCHDGPVHVFTTGQARIWAGTREEILSSPKGWDLIICLLGQGGAPKHMVVTSVGAASIVAGLADSIPTISIDWPDGDIPSDLPPGFWRRLADAIQTKVIGNVGVYCMGGHGRTGTALSILAALTGACPNGDPVKFVRSAYCREAVEMESQCDYIGLITGRDVTSEGSLEHAWGAYQRWQSERAKLYPWDEDDDDIVARSRRAIANLHYTPDEDRDVVTNGAGDVVWNNA